MQSESTTELLTLVEATKALIAVNAELRDALDHVHKAFREVLDERDCILEEMSELHMALAHCNPFLRKED